MATRNGLVTRIIKNILFCVKQKKLIQVWNELMVSNYGCDETIVPRDEIFENQLIFYEIKHIF